MAICPKCNGRTHNNKINDCLSVAICQDCGYRFYVQRTVRIKHTKALKDQKPLFRI